MNSDGWPPNGCAKCGQPERGHPGGDYAYVPPPDALRLARMRARREARLNPPGRTETPPDLITTLTANTSDWEDASRYLLHQLRQPQMRRGALTLRPSALPSRPPETASERFAGLLAHGGYVAPVQAISTPGPNEPSIYTVRPGTDHPARMRIGDGDWVPCRAVGFDMTPDGAGTVVSAELGEDGRFRLDTEYRLNIEFDAAALSERMAELGRFFRDMGHAMADSLAPAGAAAASATRQLAAQLDPELEAARHWEAQGKVCCHVCGPDPGHVCDAKAVTTLRHALPSGGVRDLPLCGPCAAAENAEAPPADAPPQFDRLFVIAATRVQFTEWCHDLGIAPRDRRVVHLTGHRQLEGVARGLRYLVLDWPEGPGFAAVAIRDTLRSRDAVPVGDGEFAAWRAALDFTAATHRLLTEPGVAREEIEQAIAGIRALADNPDT